MKPHHLMPCGAAQPTSPHATWCKGCEMGLDNFEHLFGYCAYAQITWGEDDLKVINDLQLNWNGDWKALIHYVPRSQRGSKESREFTLFAANLFQHIWKERNAVTDTRVKKPLAKFITYTSSRFFEYKCMNLIDSNSISISNPTPTTSIQCTTHLDIVIRIFSDATWTPNEASVAGVAYTREQCILSWLKSCHAHSPTQAQAYALRLAAQITRPYRW